MYFHQQVPEEVAFYRLFPYLDFHLLIKVIPHVCSSWRRLVIEKLETLHFYPNVQLLSEEEQPNIMTETNVQTNLLPFIRYTIKFVQSNQMTIKYLFINGQIEDIICRKQFRLFGNLNPLARNEKVFIPNRAQRESIEFFTRLQSLKGGYIPNSLTEPALRRFTHNLFNNGTSPYGEQLWESMDVETMKELVKICKDTELVSLSNVIGDSSGDLLRDILMKSKIAVIDNTRLPRYGSGHFEYLYFSENFYFYDKQEFEYNESRNNILVCKSNRRDFGLLAKEVLNEKSRVVDYNITTEFLERHLTEQDIRNALEKLCKNLTNNPQLRRLTLGLEFFKSNLMQNIPFDYGGVGGMIEELYIRIIGDTFSKIRLDSFVSGFVNVKHLVLEDVKSKDCHLVRESISGMIHLETFRISFYEHQGSEDEVKYFELISVLSRNYKNLTKLLFTFPYMEFLENESLLKTTLDKTLRICWISLKKLPDLSNETILQLERIPKLVFSTKPRISNDNSSLTQIDYDQDIDMIIEQRKEFKQALQEAEISCPGCLKVFPRRLITGHLATCHNLPDLCKKNTNQLRTLSVCPCCKEEYPTKEVEEHLLNCTEKHLKFKLEDTTLKEPLYHVGYYPLDFGN